MEILAILLKILDTLIMRYRWEIESEGGKLMQCHKSSRIDRVTLVGT